MFAVICLYSIGFGGVGTPTIFCLLILSPGGTDGQKFAGIDSP